MWPFSSSKTIESSGVLSGLEDFHSHILPKVDDGSRSVKESLETLQRMEQLGVKRVWLTSHIMEDVPNESEKLRQCFDSFKQEYKGGIELKLAAEYMLDGLFDKRFERRDLLPIGEKSDMLLVETTYFSPPYNLMATLRDVMSHGYFPLLAHVERYNYMQEKEYEELKQMGVRFQLNIPSLAGVYGATVCKRAEMLLHRGFYDYAGSDFHSLRSYNRVLEAKISRRTVESLQKLIQR